MDAVGHSGTYLSGPRHTRSGPSPVCTVTGVPFRVRQLASSRRNSSRSTRSRWATSSLYLRALRSRASCSWRFSSWQRATLMVLNVPLRVSVGPTLLRAVTT